MVDVVHHADALAQLEQIANGGVKVIRFEGAAVEAGGIGTIKQLDVELQAAYAREIVLARVEEHAVKQRSCRIQSWRVAGPQFPIDLDQSFLRSLYRIAPQSLADHRSHIVPLREEHLNLADAGFHDLGKLVGGYFRVRFHQDFAA